MASLSLAVQVFGNWLSAQRGCFVSNYLHRLRGRVLPKEPSLLRLCLCPFYGLGLAYAIPRYQIRRSKEHLHRVHTVKYHWFVLWLFPLWKAAMLDIKRFTSFDFTPVDFLGHKHKKPGKVLSEPGNRYADTAFSADRLKRQSAYSKIDSASA
jgi:hypothetical protein